MKPSRRRFEAGEYLARQAKTRKSMIDQGIDVLVIADPSNICWLTGYDAWSFYVYQCVVISADSELFWFGRGIDAPSAQITTNLPDDDIIAYPDHYVQSAEVHPTEYLAQILKQRQLDTGVIGGEMDNYYQTYRGMHLLIQCLPDASFTDATALVNWQRAIKSPQEIEYMRRAGSVIEEVYKRVLDVAEPGLRKNDLVAEILHASTRGTPDIYGDYAAIQPLLASGPEAAACHLTWDDTPIENNTGMCLELAGVHNRYHCPVSRTLHFGKPSQKYLDIEAVILDAIDMVQEMFRPGTTCGEVATAFTQHIRKHGYEKDNRCGYSIGLSYPPDWGERTMSLRDIDDTVLEEGMCFHFMPGMWFDDWGFEITESMTVTPEGGLMLSQVPRKLFVK
ncbi:M24 family metallopeptidase [Marinobacterium lutimaris]|uniref:Ectoine hydrolase n=1 Tax=Marinobacterium lutimaris TaxID=568106 RepID=A0A1H6CZJ4_9GAMM|nr:M24 family metallopeptidase [Marinobacterium lutimaris]SEG78579.1 ectoine hydrolase [Marinobacterium lutimaris]